MAGDENGRPGAGQGRLLGPSCWNGNRKGGGLWGGEGKSVTDECEMCDDSDYIVFICLGAL